MKPQPSIYEAEAPDPAGADPGDDSGRRIRWERHPQDATLIVVLDALTGTVIAVVRSLFEISAPRS